MSVEVLTVELEQRRQELIREQEENERARRIRAELLQPEPPPVRLIFPLKPPARTPYDEAASAVLAWWEECKTVRGPGEKRQFFVTNAKVEALAKRIRGLGRGRRNK
jgi:hypothetical protein